VTPGFTSISTQSSPSKPQLHFRATEFTEPAMLSCGRRRLGDTDAWRRTIERTSLAHLIRRRRRPVLPETFDVRRCVRRTLGSASTSMALPLRQWVTRCDTPLPRQQAIIGPRSRWARGTPSSPAKLVRTARSEAAGLSPRPILVGLLRRAQVALSSASDPGRQREFGLLRRLGTLTEVDSNKRLLVPRFRGDVPTSISEGGG